MKKEFQFTPEQLQWLDYLKEHLKINLAIDKDNFDVVPIFEQHGGLTRAKEVFGEQFDRIIQIINYKLVA